MDNQEFVVAARTYLYLAPVGTTVPTTVGEPPDPWRNVGFTTPDNCQFATEPQFTNIMSAQSDYKTGRIQTGDAAKLAVVLQQWNTANFQAVYGGGTVTEITPAVTPPVYKYVPPRLGARQEVAAILRAVYGAKEYLWICAKTFQGEGVTLDLNKTQESRLPLSLEVLGGDSADAWYMLSNDPAMAPVA